MVVKAEQQHTLIGSALGTAKMEITLIREGLTRAVSASTASAAVREVALGTVGRAADAAAACASVCSAAAIAAAAAAASHGMRPVQQKCQWWSSSLARLQQHCLKMQWLRLALAPASVNQVSKVTDFHKSRWCSMCLREQPGRPRQQNKRGPAQRAQRQGLHPLQGRLLRCHANCRNATYAYFRYLPACAARSRAAAGSRAARHSVPSAKALAAPSTTGLSWSAMSSSSTKRLRSTWKSCWP